MGIFQTKIADLKDALSFKPEDRSQLYALARQVKGEDPLLVNIDKDTSASVIEDLKRNLNTVRGLKETKEVASKPDGSTLFRSEEGRYWMKGIDGKIYYNSQGNNDRTWGCLSDKSIYLQLSNNQLEKVTMFTGEKVACFFDGKGKLYSIETAEEMKPEKNNTFVIPPFKSITKGGTVLLDSKNTIHEAIMTSNAIGYFDNRHIDLFTNLIGGTAHDEFQRLSKGDFSGTFEHFKIEYTSPMQVKIFFIEQNETTRLCGQFTLKTPGKELVWKP